MNENSGFILPVKEGLGQYLRKWYDGLFPDTKAMQEYTQRGFSRAAVWAPGRMVDQAESMLESYRRNENGGPAGQNAVLPMVIVAVGRDMMPVNGDVGWQVGERMLIRLADDPDASVYGYRQGFYELRAQVVIAATEEATAKSLAAQFQLYVGSPANRRFDAIYQWGQYSLPYRVTIESPDVVFMAVQTDAKNLTMLAGDLTLRMGVPFLDAPKAGEPNDGTSHNPPGYPIVGTVHVESRNSRVASDTDSTGTEFGTVPPVV